jgi:pyruvate formate lyase activating enzyme
VDPIEKKPLHHFLPGTPVLSFGTAGCNLSCKFCQNWDISKSREIEKLSNEASPDQIALAAREFGCRSVAFTYNDPTIFLEYAIDVARACHEVGVRTVAVTAGYICPKPREDFYRHVDAANVDLKAFTDKFYREVTGAKLQPVLDTLLYLRNQTSVWLEVTNLVIPGYNDSVGETEEMARWIVENLGPDTPLHFSAFHPDWKMRSVPPTPLETLRRARRIAISNGLRYVYTGNVHDPEGENTFCHGCGDVVIGRDGYDLTEWNLTPEGCCRICATPLPGVLEEWPGAWNGRPMPVRIGVSAACAATLRSRSPVCRAVIDEVFQDNRLSDTRVGENRPECGYLERTSSFSIRRASTTSARPGPSTDRSAT